MTTTTIRISTRTRDLLHELAHTAGVSMHQALEQALEQYRRQQILHAANAAYAALLADPSTRTELEKERAAWDVTLTDGLEET